MKRAQFLVTIASLGLFAICTFPVSAATPSPYSIEQAAQLKQAVPRITLPAVDQARLLREDAAQLREGEAPNKRLRVAAPNTLEVTPERDGRWDALPDGRRLWRVTVHADGATDLRLGFSRFVVPAEATLFLIDPATSKFQGPFDLADTNAQGALWLAPFGGASVTVELDLPAGTELAPGSIVLTRVGTGYRNTTGHGGVAPNGGVSGTCNIDVVCPLGNPYPLEKRAVAKFYFDEPDGTYICTGTLMNNTYQNFVPYFLTANHCISTQAAASSMSLIWNYQSPTCGAHGNGSTNDTQNGGATLLAHRADVDFALVRLSSQPSSSFQVAYAGWYAGATVAGGSIGIHHPSGWVKAITQYTSAPATVNSCIGTGGVNSHWRVGAYAQGTTEGGSSGSALLIPSGDPSGYGNRVIGFLSGGTAACSGSVPNSGTDCYGKMSVAFDGASASQRLRDWLADGIFKSGFESASLRPADEISVPTVAAPPAAP